MTLEEHYELLKQKSLEFTKVVEQSKVDESIKEAVLSTEQSRDQLTETIKNKAMKSFFSQVFTPIRKPKVRIEYANGSFILVDESDQSLGYEFKNFNDAFRFAKSVGYEFSDNDYFV
jgi:uncharacterized protein YdcH (DUF465 family)